MTGSAEASWPFAAVSGALQVGYCLFLVWAYEKGELGQVFPIARGAAPLLVAVGAAVFAGERLSPTALGGLVLLFEVGEVRRQGFGSCEHCNAPN